MDTKLLELLCCPVSHVPLRRLTGRELHQLNQCIQADAVDTVAGERVHEALREGLVSDDGKIIYRIDDGIPVLLPEEGIGTTQINGWA